jgi:hypothetical protein
MQITSDKTLNPDTVLICIWLVQWRICHGTYQLDFLVSDESE